MGRGGHPLSSIARERGRLFFAEPVEDEPVRGDHAGRFRRLPRTTLTHHVDDVVLAEVAEVGVLDSGGTKSNTSTSKHEAKRTAASVAASVELNISGR